MKNTDTRVTVNGIGFYGLLTILFIALKLLGVILWPWVWVLSPLWISVCIKLLFVIIVAIIVAIADRW